MSRVNVLVLGGTGMLGSMIVDLLSRERSIRVMATGRNSRFTDYMSAKVSDVHWYSLDAIECDEAELAEILVDANWVVNAIGATNRQIVDTDAEMVERAIRVNSFFPHQLATLAAASGARVLNVSTDCVFSGESGGYLESSICAPGDVYGKTKSLGEVKSASVTNLRTSFVGPEPKAPQFLLEWVLGMAKDSELKGFTNHIWSGVTTLHFAKIVSGIVVENLMLPNVHNIVPLGQISKADLLRTIADAFGRSDLTVNDIAVPVSVNRSLATENIELNRKLWSSAGYDEPPAYGEMLRELASFDYRFARS